MFYLYSPYLSPGLSIHEISSAFPLFCFSGKVYFMYPFLVLLWLLLLWCIISEEQSSSCRKSRFQSSFTFMCILSMFLNIIFLSSETISLSSSCIACFSLFLRFLSNHSVPFLDCICCLYFMRSRIVLCFSIFEMSYVVNGNSLEVLHFESLSCSNVSYLILTALEMNSKEVSVEFIVLKFMHDFL